jgi:4'-phosphopantetheinyl transferase
MLVDYRGICRCAGDTRTLIKGARVTAGNLAFEWPELHENEVHIWVVSLARLPAISPWHLLSADEQNRANRFCFETDKNRFIYCRGALRRILGRYLCTSPMSLRFEYDVYGKPKLREPETAIEFNVSHSRNIALIALARKLAVGIDVEAVREDIIVGDIVRLVFSTRELERLHAMPPEEQRLEIFRTWAAKEAYVKVNGEGLSVAPNSLEADELPVRLLDVRNGYVAAFATPEHVAIDLRKFEFA